MDNNDLTQYLATFWHFPYLRKHQWELVQQFRDINAFYKSTPEQFARLGIAKELHSIVMSDFDRCYGKTYEALGEMEQQGIVAINFTEDQFPHELVNEAMAGRPLEIQPLVVYVAGETWLLGQHSMLIDGTSTPTTSGMVLSGLIAQKFLEKGWNMISTFREGCNHATTLAALDGQQKVIGLAATPIDMTSETVQRILHQSGVVLSMFPSWHVPESQDERFRDELATCLSGLNILVQGNKSCRAFGIARAARAHQRLVYCPEPIEKGWRGMSQYAGIKWLHESPAYQIPLFRSWDYDRMDRRGRNLLIYNDPDFTQEEEF